MLIHYPIIYKSSYIEDQSILASRISALAFQYNEQKMLRFVIGLKFCCSCPIKVDNQKVVLIWASAKNLNLIYEINIQFPK